MSNTAGQSDPSATDDSSVSAPAQTSTEAPLTTAVDSVSSASDALSTSEPVDSQSSSEVSSADPLTTQQSSAVESVQSSETEVSSAATSSVAAEPTSSSDASQPSQIVTSSKPVTTEAKKSSSENNDSSSSDDQPTATTEPTSDAPKSTVILVTKSSGQTSVVVVVTSTTINEATGADASSSATSTSDSPALGGSGGNSDKGLSQGSKVAIGVVVPIAAIAILALVGLFWWKKRRSRKQAQEERRKEVEDYAYNPNADPTVPSVLGDGYEMREDTSSAGYRGWGNTTISSTGRKASTTMSGGQTGQAYSDVTSPIRGNASDGRSNDPLMDGSYSPEGEILGAMGPNAANNRGADVHRGPSNASSSYSAARSEGSDPVGPAYSGGAYYDQYAQNNPFGDSYNGQAPAAPVIRDNPARRNTRIENPSHYPQQSAGISQNF